MQIPPRIFQDSSIKVDLCVTEVQLVKMVTKSRILVSIFAD
jgi:hypothetical protein